MSTKQMFDSEKVAEAMVKLGNADKKINDAFLSLKTKMYAIEKNWKGPAGNEAVRAICAMSKYNDRRSMVLANYVCMLDQKVQFGYYDAEDHNKGLAANFL